MSRKLSKILIYFFRTRNNGTFSRLVVAKSCIVLTLIRLNEYGFLETGGYSQKKIRPTQSLGSKKTCTITDKYSQSQSDDIGL